MFGKIVDEKMFCSNVGNIVRKHWYELPDRFPNVSLDAFVVMPDHVHGIIQIRSSNAVETCRGTSETRGAETRRGVSLYGDREIYFEMVYQNNRCDRL